MTKEEILQFEPAAARLLGREVISIDTVAGGATLRYKAPPGTVQGGMHVSHARFGDRAGVVRRVAAGVDRRDQDLDAAAEELAESIWQEW